MKNLFYILALLTFISCGKEQGKTEVQFDMVKLLESLSAADMRDIIIGGRNSQNQFFQVRAGGNLQLEIDNGTWSFFVLAWQKDGAAFQGSLRCGVVKNINLNGTATNVAFNLSRQNCLQNSFTEYGNLGSFNNQVKPFQIQICKNKNTCDYASLSSSEKIQSVRLMVPKVVTPKLDLALLPEEFFDEYDEDDNMDVIHFINNHLEGVALQSACLPVDSTTGLVNGQFRLPMGGSEMNFNLFIPMLTVVSYTTNNCSGKGMGDFTPIRGLASDAILENSSGSQIGGSIWGMDSDQQPRNFLKDQTGAMKLTMLTGHSHSGPSEVADVCLTSPATSQPSGSGTPSDPYVICHGQQFGNLNNSSASFVLGNNLDMSNVSSPVNNFSGELDGNYFSIEGFSYQPTDSDNVGLFQTLNGATIKNLFLHNIDVHGEHGVGALAGTITNSQIENVQVHSSQIVGVNKVGGLAGEMINSTLFNVIVQGGTSIISSAGVGVDARAGGLVGHATGSDPLASADFTLRGLKSHASIQAAGKYIGGLFGQISHYKLRRAAFRGDINLSGCPGAYYEIEAGGLFGAADNIELLSYYMDGKIHDNCPGGAHKAYIGGVIGNSLGTGNITISNGYFAGEMLGLPFQIYSTNKIGGFAGYFPAVSSVSNYLVYQDLQNPNFTNSSSVPVTMTTNSFCGVGTCINGGSVFTNAVDLMVANNVDGDLSTYLGGWNPYNGTDPYDPNATASGDWYFSEGSFPKLAGIDQKPASSWVDSFAFTQKFLADGTTPAGVNSLVLGDIIEFSVQFNNPVFLDANCSDFKLKFNFISATNLNGPYSNYAYPHGSISAELIFRYRVKPGDDLIFNGSTDVEFQEIVGCPLFDGTNENTRLMVDTYFFNRPNNKIFNLDNSVGVTKHPNLVSWIDPSVFSGLDIYNNTFVGFGNSIFIDADYPAYLDFQAGHTGFVANNPGLFSVGQSRSIITHVKSDINIPMTLFASSISGGSSNGTGEIQLDNSQLKFIGNSGDAMFSTESTLDQTFAIAMKYESSNSFTPKVFIDGIAQNINGGLPTINTPNMTNGFAVGLNSLGGEPFIGQMSDIFYFDIDVWLIPHVRKSVECYIGRKYQLEWAKNEKTTDPCYGY